MEYINFSTVCVTSGHFANFDKTHGVTFIESRITNLIFSNSYLEDVNFQSAEIKNFEFIETNLKDCWFKDTKMWSGNFINSNITYCDFTKSLIDHVNFNNLAIDKTYFVSGYIVDCDWSVISFNKVDFSLSTWFKCQICNSAFSGSVGLDEIRTKTKIINSYWDDFEISNL
jgi:uncharacterized protein YjbI with pentapeptide repeats